MVMPGQTPGLWHMEVTMKIRRSIAAAGTAAILGAGAFLLPAAASVHSVTHTLRFTAVSQQPTDFSKTASGQAGTDFSEAGKVIGFDVLYFAFNPVTHTPSGGVTLDTNGGFLYGTLTPTKGPVTHGVVTGGTGRFKGVTGTITGRSLNKAGTWSAVTITYHK
jgi:hypothetical protein